MTLDDVLPFQGNLKELSSISYEKLRRGLIRYGFSSPLIVWRSEGKNFILDGHQRILVLKRMRDEGWLVPRLPVAWIEAKDEKEAKRKLLLMIGQYGRVTDDGLYEFLNKSEINLSDMNDVIDIPEFDIEEFEKGYGLNVSGNDREALKKIKIIVKTFFFSPEDWLNKKQIIYNTLNENEIQYEVKE